MCFGRITSLKKCIILHFMAKGDMASHLRLNRVLSEATGLDLGKYNRIEHQLFIVTNHLITVPGEPQEIGNETWGSYPEALEKELGVTLELQPLQHKKL